MSLFLSMLNIAQVRPTCGAVSLLTWSCMPTQVLITDSTGVKITIEMGTLFTCTPSIQPLLFLYLAMVEGFGPVDLLDAALYIWRGCLIVFDRENHYLNFICNWVLDLTDNFNVKMRKLNNNWWSLDYIKTLYLSVYFQIILSIHCLWQNVKKYKYLTNFRELYISLSIVHLFTVV